LKWLPLIPAIVLLAFAAWVLTRRPNEIIQDSEKFTDALKLWRPIITEKCNSPRDLKRFLNRVRYIAMRWRKPSEQKTLLQRLIEWRPRQRAVEEEPADINEPGIVLMAATEPLGGEHALNRPDVVLYLAQHTRKWGKPDWERFREINGEVEVN